ncbi:hypothetical protein ABTZ59_23020 [Streptomyces sp. NPDC094034]|uniref:hypothetical protein n=1 Tax=Streptomyces sp. NPDC094034 TaxID=3155309 RepID=UPI0033279ADE
MRFWGDGLLASVDGLRFVVPVTPGVPAAGALRPLRDPDAPELDEDEDESVGSE